MNSERQGWNVISQFNRHPNKNHPSSQDMTSQTLHWCINIFTPQHDGKMLRNRIYDNTYGGKVLIDIKGLTYEDNVTIGDDYYEDEHHTYADKYHHKWKQNELIIMWIEQKLKW